MRIGSGVALSLSLVVFSGCEADMPPLSLEVIGRAVMGRGEASTPVTLRVSPANGWTGSDLSGVHFAFGVRRWSESGGFELALQETIEFSAQFTPDRAAWESELVLTAAPDTLAGEYDEYWVGLRPAGGALKNSASQQRLAVEVTGGDFTASATPSDLMLPRLGSATFTVSLQKEPDFTGAVQVEQVRVRSASGGLEPSLQVEALAAVDGADELRFRVVDRAGSPRGAFVLVTLRSSTTRRTVRVPVLVSADLTADDAGSTDAGQPDAGTSDGGATDAGYADAGATDAGSPDAGGVDSGLPPGLNLATCTCADSTLVPLCTSVDCSASYQFTDACLAVCGQGNTGAVDCEPQALACGGAGVVPTIHQFQASPSLIQPGDSATLQWSVSGTARDGGCVLDPGAASYPGSAGTVTVTPASTTTYTLTCAGTGGAATASAQVQVVPNQPPTATIDTPTGDVTIAPGESVNLTATCTDDGVGGAPGTGWWLHADGGYFAYVDDPGPQTFSATGTTALTYQCADVFGVEDPTPPSVRVTVAAPAFAQVRGVRSSSEAGHACGLTTAGALYCWGNGRLGALGQGAQDTADHPHPRRVGTASTWTKLDVGQHLSCAINASHELWCWGGRADQGFGAGTLSSTFTPTQLGGAEWSDVSLGAQHVCAVKLDGTLHCWGWNQDFQLGLDDTAERLTFTQVGTDTDWLRVSAGVQQTCALKTGNRLFCWGRNSYGEVGVGGTTVARVPTEVGAAVDWVQVATGAYFTCGVDLLHRLYCWGGDFFGQLGDGTPGTTVAEATKVPTQVGTATDWAEVSTGYSHTCARTTAGTLSCWGADTFGQLGDGSPGATHTPTPTQVGTQADWTQVWASSLFTCGVRNGGAAWCWGHNTAGSLGNGTSSSGTEHDTAAPGAVVFGP